MEHFPQFAAIVAGASIGPAASVVTTAKFVLPPERIVWLRSLSGGRGLSGAFGRIGVTSAFR
jgi:hypothetical protein